ncbi:hypothetical protein ACWDRX_22415, partial [Streptomyces nigra]
VRPKEPMPLDTLTMTGFGDVARQLPQDAGGNADVCALGRKYGGWRADSQEARICDQAYGR